MIKNPLTAKTTFTFQIDVWKGDVYVYSRKKTADKNYIEHNHHSPNKLIQFWYILKTNEYFLGLFSVFKIIIMYIKCCVNKVH